MIIGRAVARCFGLVLLQSDVRYRTAENIDHTLRTKYFNYKNDVQLPVAK
jgi:hypothetical protein